MNYSNLLPDNWRPMTADELRSSIAKLRALADAQVGPPPGALMGERLILPPDWETAFHPQVVAEIRRLYGR